MGRTTYDRVADHVTQGTSTPEDVRWPYELPCWVFTHRELVLLPGDLRVTAAPVAQVHAEMVTAARGRVPRHVELRLTELAPNGEFACARYEMLKDEPPAP